MKTLLTFEMYWLAAELEATDDGVLGALLAKLGFEGLAGISEARWVSLLGEIQSASLTLGACREPGSVLALGAGITNGRVCAALYHVLCNSSTASQ